MSTPSEPADPRYHDTDRGYLAHWQRIGPMLEGIRREELRRQGMQSYGELILCLPGETKQSFLKAVEELLDAGCKRISAHQLMLLHGAPLANPEIRSRQRRFRWANLYCTQHYPPMGDIW